MTRSFFYSFKFRLFCSYYSNSWNLSYSRYDFGKESIHIDELIAVFGEEYQTDTDISGTKYYWKDEKFKIRFF